MNTISFQPMMESRPIREIDGIPVGGKAPEILKRLQDALTEKFLRACSKK